ncbi:anthranilate phosphoribosyltransferase [Brochothrix campestris]|uniref:anthranilate phosphoribosyltransferase n=2 Tax=Brochothrix campestris TaxID=2757 RepID=UPI0038D047B0
MILLIDNYDSFTYNVYHQLLLSGEEVKVVRNDALTVAAIEALQPSGIVLSPGPGRPEDAGICLPLIQQLGAKIPMLGICLGHQALAQAFGYQVNQAEQIKHGKTSTISHQQVGIFKQLPADFEAMRYHSLVVDETKIEDTFEIVARANDDREIMAIQHRSLPLYGIQFHPESIGTPAGQRLIDNFVQRARSHISFTEYLNKLSAGEHLSQQEARLAANRLFDQSLTDSEIAAFLMALKMKGETAAEIAGIVEAMRAHALPLPQRHRQLMCNCGTGGDRSGTFNISTTAAFVLAGAGVKVAKHGNRSISSKSGSADVLEALNVSLNATPAVIDHQLATTGMTFLFAPHVHPHLGQVMRVRQALGIPTVFNIIGPLTNPYALDYQVVGVYRADLVEPMAKVLVALGRKKAIVVHGYGGLDEASLAGDNQLAIIANNSYQLTTLNPQRLGFRQQGNETLKGKDVATNATILTEVLAGKKGPYRDAVVLNSAIGLVAAELADTFAAGVKLAEEAIDSQRAAEQLHYLQTTTEAIG